MKRQKQMQKAFGINEFGLVDFPVKISNVQVSRIVYGNERGCSWCFPHGWETDKLDFHLQYLMAKFMGFALLDPNEVGFPRPRI